ncbi:hypothetical protein CU276_00720 [Yersinia kristensenii]|nr:hypothetical protein CU276_00720 [Yersinia kristensenii]
MAAIPAFFTTIPCQAAPFFSATHQSFLPLRPLLAHFIFIFFALKAARLLAARTYPQHDKLAYFLHVLYKLFG